jgi:hypothetical protein
MAARYASSAAPAIWRSPQLETAPDGGGRARARLLAFALPAMESLYRQFADPALTVLLSDRDGCILGMVGAGVARREAIDAGHVPAQDDALGNIMPSTLERPGGRNGIAALQFDATAADPSMLGIAASILAPDQQVFGILGAVGFFEARALRAEHLAHPNALLQTTAEMIEHRLIEHDERGFLVLRFHPRRGLLGSPLEALAVFDHDSRLVAANRVARRLLPGGDVATGTQCMTLFDAHWRGLVGYAALCLAEPFTLRMRGGMPLFAHAVLR